MERKLASIQRVVAVTPIEGANRIEQIHHSKDYEKFRRARGQCVDCGITISRKTAKRCRPCFAKARTIHPDKQRYQRDWQLQKKYGMSLEEFDAYWVAQRGQCFICKVLMTMPTKTRGQGLRAVTVDHDHKSGKVRALLCSSCNRALGFFNDDIELLKKAVVYMEMG